MKFSNSKMEYIAYGTLGLLIFFVILCSLKFKANIIQDLSFREKIYQNSNSNYNSNSNLVEGFSFSKSNNDNGDDIEKMILRKLNALGEELGGNSGKRQMRKILEKTKKLCDLESTKCMMMMLDENKGTNTLNIDKMILDDTSEACIKCKNYTSLSKSISSMIDSL